MNHKIAGKYNIVRVLFLMGYVAFTCPFNKKVYYKNKEILNNKLIKAHEEVHLKQIDENGKIKFSLKYIYYLLRYGYKNNPYEVEARKKSWQKML